MNIERQSGWIVTGIAALVVIGFIALYGLYDLITGPMLNG